MSVLAFAPRMRRFHELAPGNGSFEIEDLQAQLNMIGWSLAVNGKWDAPTQEAVIRFKKQAGLPGTALADADFADALYAELESIDPATGKPRRVTQMEPINISGRVPGWGWLLGIAGVVAYVLS